MFLWHQNMNIYICNYRRWSMWWGTPGISWCPHTTSTKWQDSSRIQERLTSSWPHSWRAEVRDFLSCWELFTLKDVQFLYRCSGDNQDRRHFVRIKWIFKVIGRTSRSLQPHAGNSRERENPQIKAANPTWNLLSTISQERIEGFIVKFGTNLLLDLRVN